MKRIKTLRYLLLAGMLVLTVSVNAIPAKKGIKRTITLADGTKVEAELNGDEFSSYWQTADNRCFQLNPEAKVYQKIDKDKVLLEGSIQRSLANQMRSKRLAAPRKTITGEATSYKGKKKGLIILVNFKDKSFAFGHNQAYFNKIANGTNFTNSIGFVGSVKDYFLAQSNGQFELDFDVVGPYTLSKDYAYYGAHSSDGSVNDVRPGTMVQEAVALADADVNYTDYNWNDDDEVDQVFVLFAGLGEASGGDENTIWPHEWTLESSNVGQRYLTKDGIYVNTYACGPENTLNELGRTRIDGIGTICHEFSHCLGYPDMYDTANGSSYGMGSWDLMCSGNYNGRSFCPPNYSAYEKWMAGWITPIVLDKATTVKGLPAQASNYGKAYIIYNSASTDEYYMLENRQTSAGIWDFAIPGSGLMIQHIDYNKDIWSSNHVNSIVNYSKQYGDNYKYLDNDHQRLTIFHADNTAGSSDESTDLYPNGGNNSLTDTSTPNALIYNGGTLMGKPVTNITQNADGTISFDFMGGSATNVIDGIAAVRTQPETANSRIYTLDGRYAGTDASALGHGVYIQKGKKIVK